MMRLPAMALSLVVLSTQAAVSSEPPAQSPQVAYQAKDYPACARLYGAQADRDPPVRGAAYDAACCLALAGDREGAFARLLSTPTDDLRRHIAEDPDLESLHGDPRWIELIDTFRRDEAQRLANVDVALREELLRRMSVDQTLRNRAIKEPDNAELDRQLTQADRDNTAWLKALLEERGWPGYRLVGRDGSQAAWLLAQHADLDPAFQAHVLVLLETAVDQNQASGVHLAYLTDRVRLAQDKPQIYGTQFHRVDGEWVPRPLADPDRVDERRRGLGMDTLAEYSSLMKAIYTPAD